MVSTINTFNCYFWIFHHKRAPTKSGKIFFLSPIMLFLPQDFQIFVILLLLVQCFKYLRRNWNGMIMTSWNGLHKLSPVIFWISQKTIWLKTSKLSKWWITTEKLKGHIQNQFRTGSPVWVTTKWFAKKMEIF